MDTVLDRARLWEGPWIATGALVAALELLGVGGTALAAAAHGHHLIWAGYTLLALASGAIVLSRRRLSLAGFALALSATVAYYALGYPADGPVTIGLLATLLVLPAPERPWRTIIAGAITIVSLLAVRGAFSSYRAFWNPDTIATPVFVAVLLGVSHGVKSWRSYRAALAEQTREQHAVRRVTEERLRIARELHDVVSHSISMINVQAGVAAHLLDEQPEQARQALVAIKEASREALREMRGILGVLREVDEAAPRAPAPGLAQLDVLVDTATRAGLPTTLSVRGDALPLAPAADLAAYRIVQESLTNVLRHAGPASAEITVSYENSRVLIEVIDDGPGRETGERPEGSGHGIAGMRERAAAVGGELEAGPRPWRGFRVKASLPGAGTGS